MTSLALILFVAVLAWAAVISAFPGIAGLSAAMIGGTALGSWSLWRSRGRRRS